MLLGWASEEQGFIKVWLSQGLACSRHSINVPFSLFSHYFFQDSALSMFLKTQLERRRSRGGGVLVADPTGPLGGRKATFDLVCSWSPPEMTRLALRSGWVTAKRALQDSTAVQVASAHHPALQGKQFCVCTFSSSGSRNVCSVTLGTHWPSTAPSLWYQGSFFSISNLKNTSLGPQKPACISKSPPWDFLSSHRADNIKRKLILPFTCCVMSGKAPPLSEP